ncbi:MAG: hypothetical protein ACTJIB_12720 [Pseudoalteromonas prydzensis]|uniref:hypothetical protein n=1 Tax=Pseudoalteromonas prydzensis TaxID=182141 RepID=UPI003F9A0887
MEFNVDYILNVLNPSEQYKHFFVILFSTSTLMLLASVLTAYKFIKGRVEFATLYCAMLLTISYMSTDYLLAYLYFNGSEGLSFDEQVGLYPMYSFFDVFTGIVLLLTTPFIVKSAKKTIQASTCFIVIMLMVNAIAHILYVLAYLLTSIDATTISIAYIATINIADTALIIALFVPGVINRLYEKQEEKKELCFS